MQQSGKEAKHWKDANIDLKRKDKEQGYLDNLINKSGAPQSHPFPQGRIKRSEKSTTGSSFPQVFIYKKNNPNE